MQNVMETKSCPLLNTVKQSTIIHDGWQEHCLTHRDSTFIDPVQRSQMKSLAIVRQDVFECDGAEALRAQGARPAEASSKRSVAWPVTRLRCLNGGGPGLGGNQVVGITNRKVMPLTVEGRLLGFHAEDAHARYCWLTGLRPRTRSFSEARQAQDVFELMEAALAGAGMTFRNVVRTWFFNHRILEWYDEFNQVRSQFFREHGVFEGLVPASTGVGMPHTEGGALVVDAFAILPFDTGAGTGTHSETESGVRIQAVPSPLQCPALDYGSSFSRAVEIQTPTHRRLMISGTASIDIEGRTAHVGDVRKQIALTMDVVGAILESRGLSWSDAYRSIAYFKQASDAPQFEMYCREKAIPELCHVCMEADVCRDDLLFELELEACGENA